MANRTKRTTALAKRGVRQIKRSGVGKLALAGAIAAKGAYEKVKTKVARARRKRAVKKVVKTAREVAGEAARAAAVAGAIAAVAATARKVRGGPKA